MFMAAVGKWDASQTQRLTGSWEDGLLITSKRYKVTQQTEGTHYGKKGRYFNGQD